MGNKIISDIQRDIGNIDISQLALANHFDVQDVLDHELCANYMLYGLNELLTNFNLTIKTAINTRASISDANVFCCEYDLNDTKYDFIFDTNTNEIYFSANDKNFASIKAFIVCLIHILILKSSVDDLEETLSSLSKFQTKDPSELTGMLKNLAGIFYDTLTDIADVSPRSMNSLSWHPIALNVVQPTIISNKISAYSFFTAGEIDYNIQDSIFNRFTIGGVSHAKKVAEFEKRDFTIDPEHEFTKLEKERIENNKLVAGYVPTENDKELVERIYTSIKNKGRAPAIFLYGESGTGKSEKGKYFSEKLGIPYTFFCCSATTNESDMRGKPQGLGTVGGLTKFLKNAIKTIWNKDVKITKAQEADEITYTLTEIVLACKYGWIIEIQEPTLIVNAGTLGFLNCVLDDNRTLILPNGEQIPVHPNTTFIFTTNLSYEGCNLLNNSLLSRMDYVIHVDSPSFNEQVNRVISVTGFKGKKEEIELLIRAVNEIRNIISQNEITQGICDLRSAIACTLDYMNNGEESWRKSARLTIEDKAILEQGFSEQVKLKLDTILGEEI